MNELLNKFKNIKVENVSRIDEDDKNFCEFHYKIYVEGLECFKNILDSLISLYNKQIVTVKDSYDMDVSYFSHDDVGISSAVKSVLDLKEHFISKICYYLSNKYNVTIDDNKIYEKYKDIEISYHTRTNKDKTLKENLITYTYLDYNIILDEIFTMLGGFSFLEKAIDEIKQKARLPLNYYSYRKYWNYEVKGKTIKFKVNINDIKPALYYYDGNETKIIDCYSHNKVDDYKIYENGNTDIKFINASYALEFATKYLGYVAMTEEEREAYKTKC